MIEIINKSGQVLELAPDFSLSIETNNPLLNDSGELVQDIIYNASAPATDNNRLWFGNGHMIEAEKAIYQLPVMLFAHGHHLFTGVCKYKVNDDYDFSLIVNMSTAGDVLSGIRLSQLISGNYNKPSSLVSLMNDTIRNPGRYPFVFLPVKNDKMFSQPTEWPYKTKESGWVNEFSVTGGTFLNSTDPLYLSPKVPFFKLTWVLSETLKIIGFEPTGTFFTSGEFDDLYIYSRKSVLSGGILEFFRYLPYMTIADFVKQIRNRLHLSLNFNAEHKTCSVDSFSTLSSARAIDLSEYVTVFKEIAIAEDKGFLITLKKDEQDADFSSVFKLEVGPQADPEKTELEATTLNSVVIDGLDTLKSTQLIQNTAWYDMFYGQDIFSALYSGRQDPFRWDPLVGLASQNEWTLRLIQYKGLKQTGTNQYWPDARPYALNEKDAEYYSYLNGAKVISVTALLPVYIINKIQPNSVIGITSPQGVYMNCLLKQFEYNLTNDIFIECNLTLLARQEEIPFFFDSTRQVGADFNQYVICGVMASWDREETGLSTLQLEMTTTEVTQKITIPPILRPTDYRGLRTGDIVWPYVSVVKGQKHYDTKGIKLISPLKPKYLLRIATGEKIYPQQVIYPQPVGEKWQFSLPDFDDILVIREYHEPAEYLLVI